MSSACSMCEGEEGCRQGFSGVTLKEGHHLEDSGLDGRIILKWICEKWYGLHGLDRSNSG
jgi:hypothetical protein